MNLDLSTFPVTWEPDVTKLPTPLLPLYGKNGAQDQEMLKEVAAAQTVSFQEPKELAAAIVTAAVSIASGKSLLEKKSPSEQARTEVIRDTFVAEYSLAKLTRLARESGRDAEIRPLVEPTVQAYLNPPNDPLARRFSEKVIAALESSGYIPPQGNPWEAAKRPATQQEQGGPEQSRTK